MTRDWQPLIPRSKEGLYGSESEKIYPKIKDYLHGVIYDIGCGSHKITPDAIGLDGRNLDGVDIIKHGFDNYEQLVPESVDVVFSSHVLEHILDDYDAIEEWSKLLKKGGYLILYLPDGRYFNNYENIEHIRDYNYETFMMFFERAFCGKAQDYNGKFYKADFEVIESGLDVGEDKYSFYLVSRKL